MGAQVGVCIAFVDIITNECDGVRFIAGVTFTHKVPIFVSFTCSIHAVSLQLTNQVRLTGVGVVPGRGRNVAKGDVFIAAGDGTVGDSINFILYNVGKSRVETISPMLRTVFSMLGTAFSMLGTAFSMLGTVFSRSVSYSPLYVPFCWILTGIRRAITQ